MKFDKLPKTLQRYIKGEIPAIDVRVRMPIEELQDMKLTYHEHAKDYDKEPD